VGVAAIKQIKTARASKSKLEAETIQNKK